MSTRQSRVSWGATVSGRYSAYVLAALLGTYTLNFLDRVLVGILQEPLRREFALNDLQLGVLGGPAFALLYTVLGVPIARLAERTSRVTIVSVGAALWSVMTVACGLTVNYVQLLVARIGVGIGEAACTPPSHSLLSDYFPPEKRATALAIYSLGVPIGTMLAALGGGWLAQTFDWRVAFLALGAPGIALALLIKLTVREPVRAVESAHRYSLSRAFGTLGKSPTFWHVAAAGALVSFFGYGTGQFLPSYFIRSHHLTIFEASLVFAAIAGLAISAGTFAGGIAGDFIARRDGRGWVQVAAFGVLASAPLYGLAFVQGDVQFAAGAMFAAAFLQYLCLGPTYAVVQSVAPPQMRATAAATFLLVTNAIGYGLGPPAIGALSDALATAPASIASLVCDASASVCGEAGGLRLAFIIALLPLIWSGAHFLWAGRTLHTDSARARA